MRTGTRDGASFNEDDYLIENKFTDKPNYKLELGIWQKIAKEALNDNFRTPLMQVDIQDLQLVVMDYNHYTACVEGRAVWVRCSETTTAKSITLKRDDIIDMMSKAGKRKGTYHLVVLLAMKQKLVIMGRADYMQIMSEGE